jgi:type IV pilus assembly protein PilM
MSTQCIGLDIGASSIKLVQLNVARRGIDLVNFGIEPLPAQSIVDGTVMNHGAVVEAIKHLATRIRLRGKQVAIAVSGNSVIVKRLTIPHMEGAALEEQMEWEVQQNIPFSKEDVVVDYTVLVEQTPEGQMEVLLVAAKRETLDQYLHIVRDAGYQPVLVDTAAFSVQNAIEASAGFVPGELVAVINVGATFSTLSVINDGTPVFNRDVASGGKTFTEAIQRRLGVSMEGAEAYKLGSTAQSTTEVVPQEVSRILAQISEQIAGEFQRSIDFFVNDAADGQLARIYLSGGTALVPQLARAIHERAHIPVHVVDPFEHIRADPRRFDLEYLKANAPLAAVAFGLALRQPGDN